MRNKHKQRQRPGHEHDRPAPFSFHGSEQRMSHAAHSAHPVSLVGWKARWFPGACGRGERGLRGATLGPPDRKDLFAATRTTVGGREAAVRGEGGASVQNSSLRRAGIAPSEGRGHACWNPPTASESNSTLACRKELFAARRRRTKSAGGSPMLSIPSRKARSGDCERKTPARGFGRCRGLT